MKVRNALKSLFASPPPAPPPSREELQARLEKVQGYIKNNLLEIEIGSIHSSKGCEGNIIRFREEERQLKALLSSTA